MNIDENNYQTVPAETDNFPLRLRRYREAARFMMHWHGHTELLFFLRGGASIYCGGEEFLTEDGDLLIVNANELHRGDFRETGVHYFCIQIPPDFFVWAGRGSRYIFEKRIRGDARIRDMFMGIYEVYWTKAEGYRYRTLGKTYELIAYLIQNYRIGTLDEKEYEARNRKLENFNNIINYIEKNFAEPLTTLTVANMAHLSEYYFCHQFKKSTGVSFVSYLNEIRIQKAAVLLNNTRLSITEIAVEVGFHDVNYFSRVFKRNMGISPQKYRKRE